MTNESSPDEHPLAKFPDNLSDWLQALPDQKLEKSAPSRSDGERALAGLIEQAIAGQGMRDGGAEAPAPFDSPARSAASSSVAAGGLREALPDKLIEELSAAREQLSKPSAERVPEAAAGLPLVPAQSPGASPDQTITDAGTAAAGGDTGPGASIQTRFLKLFQGPRAASAKRAEAGIKYARQLSRRMRPGDWRRRYLTFLSLVHRHVFDRGIERLLFIKTHHPYSSVRIEPDGQKLFLYHGPIPGKVLEWALSALPGDLKRYAFADFRAGNGRTLLLAARRNFEHATGYAFDAEACEVLELNLSQYSRSYMSCRDVRALRGDRDGIAIPPQPAVLFFPDSLTFSNLGIILDHVSASQKRTPRPVYLVFENSGRERALDQMHLFERVPLPLLNRLKTYFFSPARIAVYKSLNDGAAG